MGFFKKKEEKKKFDYSEDTKELFAERDAFYSQMRQKMGGEASNPDAEKVSTTDKSTSKQDDLDDLLGGGDFNPYVNKEETGIPEQGNVPVAAPSAPSSSSAFSCQSCGKEFQEKWGKCPSCGGEMKKAEAAPEVVPAFTPVAPVAPETPMPSSDLNSGDPLDDLLGDFGSGTNEDSSDDSKDTSGSNIRNSGDDLGTDFGGSQSSHSTRKIRKVKKVKRSRNQL